MSDEPKKKSGKGISASRQGATRLNMMVRDLKKLKAELLPDEPELGDGVEMKNMDDFQRQKAILTKKLSALHQSITELNDLRKAKGGVRDAEIIGMQNEHYKELQQAEKIWMSLKAAFEKNVKKGKLDQKELESRKKFVELLGQQLQKLMEANSTVKRHPGQDASSAAIEKNQARAAERAKARAERHQKRAATRRAATGGKDDGSADDEVEAKRPVSAQEQAFFIEAEEKNKKMDQLLDVLSAGLKDVHEMAVDIGANLDKQNAMLEELDEKMDGTLENYISTNARLKNLLEESTGGVETWCPIIILVVILLAIVGYIFTLA